MLSVFLNLSWMKWMKVVFSANAVETIYSQWDGRKEKGDEYKAINSKNP